MDQDEFLATITLLGFVLKNDIFDNLYYKRVNGTVIYYDMYDKKVSVYTHKPLDNEVHSVPLHLKDNTEMDFDAKLQAVKKHIKEAQCLNTNS